MILFYIWVVSFLLIVITLAIVSSQTNPISDELMDAVNKSVESNGKLITYGGVGVVIFAAAPFIFLYWIYSLLRW